MDADPADSDAQLAAFAAGAAALAVERREVALGHLSRLAALVDADFDALDDVSRVDGLIELQKAQAWLDSLQVELLAAVASHDQTPEQWSREEVAAALRLSDRTAAGRLADAALVAEHLPLSLTALRDGRITAAHVRAVAESAVGLPDEIRGELERRVLPKAESHTPAQLRQSLRRAAQQLDPRAAEERHAAAKADRHVRLTPESDGMATLSAFLSAPDALACLDALNRLARGGEPGDERTIGQRRADALTTVLLTAGDEARPGPRPRRPIPEVAVVVGLSTLLGRDEDPGWLDGYGPITADAARSLAHDPSGTWRRLIADPVDGRLLDYGTAVYEPPPPLREHVLARDGTCTFPICRVAARRCDLDHINAFPDGPTSSWNLHPASRRHHNAKTHGGWRVHRDEATGTTTWTSPQGRAYPTQPPERWSIPPPVGATQSHRGERVTDQVRRWRS